MEPEPLRNNVKYKDINNNIVNIPTEEQLLNTLFNKNNNEDCIVKNVRRGSSGTYNNVRFHKIKDTNSIITYRESSSFIYQYFYSNRQTKELDNDLTISYQILDDYDLESRDGSEEKDYKNVNNFFNNTIQNNIRASTEAIAPQLYFAGFVKKEVPSGLAFHFVIISEAFDMTLHDYYANQKYKGYHNRKANLTSEKFTLFEDDKFIRDSLFNLLEATVYKLNIVCFDIKPQNCVINLNAQGEITDIRLIDWDSNYCIHDENLESNEDEIEYEKHTIFCINLIFMSLHFLRYSQYNIFIEMNLDKGTIKRIQKYICNDDAKYRTIYKLFLKDYFKKPYNNGDIEECKDIVSSLITQSNNLLNLLSLPRLTTGGKKKLKQIFKQKTNKKTRKNRSKKNKTKKGGRMDNPNPNNHTIIPEDSQTQPQRIHSAEYRHIMNIIYPIDRDILDSNIFSQPFIKLYFILYDNLQYDLIVEQLDDEELDMIILSFIQLFLDNEMTTNEKIRVREFFLQNDNEYSRILKLSATDDQSDIEIEFPSRVIQKLNEYKPIFTSMLES